MSKKPGIIPESAPVTHDETEVRQSAVIASTFANLELENTKKTLQQYVQFFAAAKEQNQRLATELAERERDSFSVVHFHRRELEKQTEALKNTQKEAAEKLDAEKTKFNEERKGLLEKISNKDAEISDLNDTIGDLQADLDALSAFKRERNDLRLELSKFQDQAKTEAEASKAEISRLRFESIEEKVRLKAEEKQLNAKFKKDVSEHAMKQLASKTKEIYSENYMLVQDKVLLEKELERVSATNTENDARLSTLRRDHSLGKSNEEEFSKRNAKLNRANKNLNEKSQVLEDNLTRVVESYEMKLAELTKKTQMQLSHMQQDRDDAHRTAAARHKELTRMRQLTKQVVQQRSELETFFNEALEFVRLQIANERSNQMLIKTGGVKKPGVPSILPRRAQPPGEGSSKPGGGQSGGGATSGGGRKPPSGKNAGGDVPDFMQGNFEALPTTMDPNAPHPSSAPNSRENVGSMPPALNPPTRGSVNTRSSSASSLPPIPGSRGNTAVGGMPPLAGGSAGGGGAPGASGVYPDGKQVDISQLAWADKERVLRILFSKINQVRQDRHKAKEGAHSTGGGGCATNSISGGSGAAPMLIQDKSGDETFLTTPQDA